MKHNISVFYYLGLISYPVICLVLTILILYLHFFTDFQNILYANPILVFLLSSFIAITNYLIFKDLTSPAVIIGFLWIVPLVVSTLEFEFLGGYSFFNEKVTLKTVLIFINSILLFSFGCLINYNSTKKSITFIICYVKLE